MWKKKKSFSGASTPTSGDKSFWKFQHRSIFCSEHYYPVKILLNLTVFELFAKKLYFDPYVLFLATTAMFFNISKISIDQFVQDTLRKNYAKIRSNWSSSFRCWKKANNNRRQQTMTDNNIIWRMRGEKNNQGNQGYSVMTIAHMAFRPDELIKCQTTNLIFI